MRTRRPKVHVTADHIARNRRQDCQLCAVALALNDSLGGAWHVCEHDAREEGPNYDFRGKRVRFTPRVRSLIRQLDAGEKVEPFSF